MPADDNVSVLHDEIRRLNDVIGHLTATLAENEQECAMLLAAVQGQGLRIPAAETSPAVSVSSQGNPLSEAGGGCDATTPLPLQRTPVADDALGSSVLSVRVSETTQLTPLDVPLSPMSSQALSFVSQAPSPQLFRMPADFVEGGGSTSTPPPMAPPPRIVLDRPSGEASRHHANVAVTGSGGHGRRGDRDREQRGAELEGKFLQLMDGMKHPLQGRRRHSTNSLPQLSTQQLAAQQKLAAPQPIRAHEMSVQTETPPASPVRKSSPSRVAAVTSVAVLDRPRPPKVVRTAPTKLDSPTKLESADTDEQGPPRASPVDDKFLLDEREANGNDTETGTAAPRAVATRQPFSAVRVVRKFPRVSPRSVSSRVFAHTGVTPRHKKPFLRRDPTKRVLINHRTGPAKPSGRQNAPAKPSEGTSPRVHVKEGWRYVYHAAGGSAGATASSQYIRQLETDHRSLGQRIEQLQAERRQERQQAEQRVSALQVRLKQVDQSSTASAGRAQELEVQVQMLRKTITSLKTENARLQGVATHNHHGHHHADPRTLHKTRGAKS